VIPTTQEHLDCPPSVTYLRSSANFAKKEIPRSSLCSFQCGRVQVGGLGPFALASCMYFELQRSGSRGLNDRRRLGMWNNSSFFSMCQRNPRIAVLTFFAFIVFGFFVYLQGGIGLGLPGSSNTRGELRNVPSQACRYPHQRVWTKYTESSNSYSFALISDMDKNSKMGEDKQWRSLLKKGTLLYDPDSGKFSVEWDSEVI